MRNYEKKVRQKLQSLCPREESGLQRQVVQVCLTTWITAFLIFYLLFFRNPKLITLLLSVFYSKVAAKEILWMTAGSVERRILVRTEKMLNDVKHFYYDTHSIVTALQEAMAEAGYEMRIHIGHLIQVLCADRIEEAAEEYNRKTQNRFLKLFLSQCVALQEYGDTEKNGESLFVRNLTNLRSDILNHLLQLDRIKLEFAGLAFVVLAPMTVLPLIRVTAVGSLPELGLFYEGTLGQLLPIIYLATTAMIYGLITEMQELEVQGKATRWLSKIEGNRYVAYALDHWERRHYGKVKQQARRLRRAGEAMTPRLFFTKKLMYLCMTVTIGSAVLFLVKADGDRFLWYEAGIIVLSGMVAYMIPDAYLRYKESLMRMNMLSEVTLFQSIIMMQMYIPDITVLRILTMIEQFSHIFRSSIRDCINEYSYSVQKALQGMKEAESYEPFRRLCDNFLAADKIGIVRAFEEVVQDRLYFQKQREEDTAGMIRKKAASARIMAFVPMLMIIITYLILPYGIEAVRQFTLIIQELGTL